MSGLHMIPMFVLVCPTLWLLPSTSTPAEAVVPLSMEIQLRGGPTELAITESVEGKEVASDATVGFEGGLAGAFHLGSAFILGIGYHRVAGSVETPNLPGHWGLGSNEFFGFAEVRHTDKDRGLAPFIGLGASLGHLGLKDEVDVGRVVLDVSGTAMITRVYGIVGFAPVDWGKIQLNAGYQFGSIPHSELDYSVFFTNEMGQVREFEADLDSYYVALVISGVAWTSH